jgi:hypothetical protein
MLTAIDFYNQPSFTTMKVHYIRTYRVLPYKLKVIDRARTKAIPKAQFRVSRAAS